MEGGNAIGDNELRYILWRSCQNLVNPGRFRSLIDTAIDINKQQTLKVGDYAERAGGEWQDMPIWEI